MFLFIFYYFFVVFFFVDNEVEKFQWSTQLKARLLQIILSAPESVWVWHFDIRQLNVCLQARNKT